MPSNREGLKITEKEWRYIAIFEQLTDVEVLDYLELDDLIVFMVRKGDAGKAVGEGGRKLTDLSQLLGGKRVKVVEHSDDLKEFLVNAMLPANVKEVEITERDGKVTAIVRVPEEEKGKAIGKGGKNLKAVRELLRRHFKVERLVLA
ncbi:MAG: NusA-like transcription termination signal-binding factor [Aigarchaeota archaeon]|nr:NusA-like transcription termination signal-binding factor [Candidatus Calditenuis fumarioli]